MGKCKVESGKWKVNPFLLGWGGCRAATGGVTLSQCKVESGKWKVNPFLLGRGGSRAARDVNPPQTGRMSRVVNPRSDRRGESTRDGIITSFPLQRGGLGWGLTHRETTPLFNILFSEQSQTIPLHMEGGFADGRRNAVASPDSEQIEHTVAKLQMRNSESVEQIQDRLGVVQTSSKPVPLLESVAHFVRTASFFPNRGRKELPLQGGGHSCACASKLQMRGGGSSCREKSRERSEQNNFPLLTFYFPLEVGGVPC